MTKEDPDDVYREIHEGMQRHPHWSLRQLAEVFLAKFGGSRYRLFMRFPLFREVFLTAKRQALAKEANLRVIGGEGKENGPNP